MGRRQWHRGIHLVHDLDSASGVASSGYRSSNKGSSQNPVIKS